MTKTEFLQQLYNHLMSLTPSERDDIISDFEEHFTAGLENGKTEEQICEELGDPYTCALQYLKETSQTAHTAPVNNPPPQNTNIPMPPKTTVQSGSVYYNGQVKGNPQRNRVLWSVMFVFGVIAAIGIYPAGVGMMIATVGLLIAAVFAGTFTASFAVGGFLISLGVVLLATGLFMVLFMTWFLKLSWRRADL